MSPRRIYGVDFTGARKLRKPITVCTAEFRGDHLEVVALEPIHSHNEFGSWFRGLREGIVGIDAPFGLPIVFAEHLQQQANLSSSSTWESTARLVSDYEPRAYELMIKRYRDARDSGKKEPLRPTDKIHRGASPIKMFNPPVGKMHLRLIPHLFASNHSIWPMRLTDSSVLVVEVYPGTLARGVLENRSYKNDKAGEPSRELARREILDYLKSPQVEATLGYRLVIDDQFQQKCIRDKGGDWIDAVIAAFEAANALANPLPPEAPHPHEGEIFTTVQKLRAAGALPQRQ